jgi:hypothetical protein
MTSGTARTRIHTGWLFSKKTCQFEKNGQWLGNSIIDFFTWKLFDVLNKLGIKDILLGVEPGTAVRSNPGSKEKISDPQDLIIFNKAKKMSSQILICQEGRLKSHPSFTSLLQNNLFRETVFSLLQLVRKQENRDYRMESPFQHYSVEVNKV